MTDAIPVLVNRTGGTAAARGDRLRDEIEAAFDAAGVAIALQLLDGCEVLEAARQVADQPLVVVGGGDGTLGCGAKVMTGGKGALGILALGTRNHLARELGVPLDLPGAARLIATRHTRAIDLARVNGELFLNNASVGFYPHMVRERDEMDLPKWVAALPAAGAALRRMKHHRLKLVAPGMSERVTTPMLFVGNNHYALEAGRLGQRDALDDGKLSVYAVASRHRMALIGFAIRAVLGRVNHDADFAALGDVSELTVTGRSRTVDIALDGEVMELKMPLEFTMIRGGLTVIAPPLEETRDTA
jgi:diacylglycerol kinase family enzyme